MKKGKEIINSEELLMIRIQSMNFQVTQIEKQKNKILRLFCQLGLEDAVFTLEKSFVLYREQFEQQLSNSGMDDCNGIFKAYQQYIDIAWDTLFSVVQSFKCFGEVVMNNDEVSVHKSR